jgi:hypothetical protein
MCGVMSGAGGKPNIATPQDTKMLDYHVGAAKRRVKRQPNRENNGISSLNITVYFSYIRESSYLLKSRLHVTPLSNFLAALGILGGTPWPSPHRFMFFSFPLGEKRACQAISDILFALCYSCHSEKNSGSLFSCSMGSLTWCFLVDYFEDSGVLSHQKYPACIIVISLRVRLSQ